MNKSILFLALPFLAACGNVNENVFVDSVPRGAQILDSEGNPTGQTTPAYLSLDSNADSHILTVNKAGWRPIPVTFTTKTETEVMGLGEAVGSIICAPCCCGLPLLNFLDPIDVNTRFVPNRVKLKLERTGGGVHVTAFPPSLEVLVDGKSRGQIMSSTDMFFPLTDGDHTLTFQAPGFESFKMDSLSIDKDTPVRLNVILEPVAGSLYIKQEGLPLNRVEVKNAKGDVVWHVNPVDNTVLVKQLPGGDYVLSLQGKTEQGKILKVERTVSITDTGLTTLALGSIPEWSGLRAWIGVELENVGTVKMKVDGIGVITYPEIKRIINGTAAARSNLRIGDVLLTLNGKDLGSEPASGDEASRRDAIHKMHSILEGVAIGSPAFLEVERNGKRMGIKLESLGGTHLLPPIGNTPKKK